MYKPNAGQISLFEDAKHFGGVTLDLDNYWIQLASLIPWDRLEERYAASFEGSATGNPAKLARMALGALLIKRHYRFSDANTVREIQMNPYLQFFIGLTGFVHSAPFEPSTMSLFRKRVGKELWDELSDCITELKG